LYRDPAFEAFDDFSDFVESVSCGTSESCQVRGSNPCRGAKPSTSNLPGTFVDSVASSRNRTLIPNIWHVLRFSQLSGKCCRRRVGEPCYSPAEAPSPHNSPLSPVDRSSLLTVPFGLGSHNLASADRPEILTRTRDEVATILRSGAGMIIGRNRVEYITGRRRPNPRRQRKRDYERVSRSGNDTPSALQPMEDRCNSLNSPK